MITIFPSCMVGYPFRPKWGPYVIEEVVAKKEPFIKSRIPNAMLLNVLHNSCKVEPNIFKEINFNLYQHNAQLDRSKERVYLSLMDE